MPNYIENVYTFFIWDILSIFMAVYCSIIIRFRFIHLQINNIASPADKRDENIQKFSFKFLQFMVFLVKFVAITNIILDFKRYIQISQAIIDSQCYSPKILNDSLSYAISLLNNTLIIYQICM